MIKSDTIKSYIGSLEKRALLDLTRFFFTVKYWQHSCQYFTVKNLVRSNSVPLPTFFAKKTTTKKHAHNSLQLKLQVLFLSFYTNYDDRTQNEDV